MVVPSVASSPFTFGFTIRIKSVGTAGVTMYLISTRPNTPCPAIVVEKTYLRWNCRTKNCPVPKPELFASLTGQLKVTETLRFWASISGHDSGTPPSRKSRRRRVTGTSGLSEKAPVRLTMGVKGSSRTYFPPAVSSVAVGVFTGKLMDNWPVKELSAIRGCVHGLIIGMVHTFSVVVFAPASGSNVPERWPRRTFLGSAPPEHRHWERKPKAARARRGLQLQSGDAT